MLDNRGIGQNVAFIKLTYKEYANLKDVPSLNELYNLIMDKDPLTKLCNCKVNNPNLNLENQLNDMIDNDLIQKNCKFLK